MIRFTGVYPQQETNERVAHLSKNLLEHAHVQIACQQTDRRSDTAGHARKLPRTPTVKRRGIHVLPCMRARADFAKIPDTSDWQSIGPRKLPEQSSGLLVLPLFNDR